MKGMKYHDYIRDLGTLLGYHETLQQLVETWQSSGLQEHDSVYEAWRFRTAFANEKYAPGIENSSEKYKENEARELESSSFVWWIPTL